MISRLTAGLRQRRPGMMRAADSMFWMVVDRLLRVVFSVVVGVWVARHLGPENLGLLTYATVFAGLFAIVGKFGLDRIVVRDLVRTPEDSPEILGTTLALKLVGGTLMLLAATAAIWIMRPADQVTRLLVVIAGLALTLDSVDTIDQYFQSLTAAKYGVWARNIALAVASLGRIILIKLDASVVAFAWALLGETVLICAGLVYFNQRFGIPMSRWKASMARAKRLLAESWPQILTSMAITVYMRIDAVMLREMTSEREVGIYAAACRLSEIWYFIPMALVASVFPSIVQVREKNPGLYIQRMLRLFSLMSGVSLTLAVPIALFATPLVSLIYGEQYVEAGPVLAVHIWSSLFVFLGTAQESWNVTERLLLLSFYRTVAGALINVGLNFLLIPKYGSLGAAWATLIAYGFAAMIGNLFSARTRPIFLLQAKSLLFPVYLLRRDS